ncbi:EAL domain-containing protein [Shewanella frigidimarina]|uniref:bifunctional diguanylate cyclase/phosphodiesterase n=1 Tax=Shewanella frigidimarina TaxID=56812 RepID=UPI003D7958E7
MLFFNRLQTRIFAFFVLLIITVLSLSFWLTYQANQRLEQQYVANQLEVASLVFESQYDNRNYYLAAFAATAAKDFGLKDIFIDGDNRSFLVALNNHRSRINASLAMAVSAEGNVIGQLVASQGELGRESVALGSEQSEVFRYKLGSEFETLSPFYLLDNKLYQIKFSPLTSGGNSVIGWVGFGFLIDDTLANSLQKLTGLNSGFMLTTENNVIAVGHSGLSLPDDETSLLSRYIIEEKTNHDYILWKQFLGEVDGQSLHAYMYKSRSDLLASIESQWLQQVAVLVMMLPVSLLLAFWISGSITRPITQLIAQARFIAQGNYDSSVSVDSSIELQQLATEFTSMQQAILQREKAIAHQAYHDPLTNLGNRNELQRMIEPWLVSGSTMGLCLINIRRMTEINVTLGHAVGDEVIKEVAKRLCEVNPDALAYRLSGDEFVLAFKHCEHQSFDVLLKKLQHQIGQDYHYQDVMLHLQFTAGVSFYQPNVDIVTLLRQADTALQHAKINKRDYQIYDANIDKNSIERFQLINELKVAIEQNQLVLYYQPKLNLAKQKITHVEALVRWNHPARGIIPPDTFIPIAEKTMQMDALTRWVITEAMDQYHRWQLLGINMCIAVNISAENLKDEQFCHWVINALAEHNVPVAAMTLEITEDAVVSDPELAVKQLTLLRKNGLTLSIDDYGTGYSSLAQLKQLPVDELKIDKSFVQKLLENEADQIIVQSTLQLAHNLGLKVVAEGIEDKATLEWLTKLNCEMGQGFYLSRPLPEQQFNDWLGQSDYL